MFAQSDEDELLLLFELTVEKSKKSADGREEPVGTWRPDRAWAGKSRHSLQEPLLWQEKSSGEGSSQWTSGKGLFLLHLLDFIKSRSCIFATFSLPACNACWVDVHLFFVHQLECLNVWAELSMEATWAREDAHLHCKCSYFLHLVTHGDTAHRVFRWMHRLLRSESKRIARAALQLLFRCIENIWRVDIIARRKRGAVDDIS